MTLREKIEMPLFPLSVFLLPGERMELHIFEPRYRQLFSELEEGGQMFGIPYAVKGRNMTLGARCRLVRTMKKYISGERDVMVEAEGIFHLEAFQNEREGKLYPFGQVSLLRELGQESANAALLKSYEELAEELVASDVPLQCVESDLLVSILASLGLDSTLKHHIMSLPSSARREQAIFEQVEYLRRLVQQEAAHEQGWYLS